jgi:solute:Na+ symporter, SSS family
MSWIDWLIVLVPVGFVLWVAVWCRKYVRGVADYLAAGRVCGRYVMSVGDVSASLGVVTLVALVEAKYHTGFALVFWEIFLTPVALILSLTGYCIYRWRETKSMSMGQFLEVRYSRSFRIFAAVLRCFAEMMTNAIGPAIAASFFIYFLGLPHKISILGLSIPMFSFIVLIILAMALVVMWPAGRLALIITDTVQGLISYPIFVIIVGFALVHFSWGRQIAPTMLDRAPGESFLNPFDISKLRDFNIFMLAVGLVGSIINRAVWIGNDSSNSGRTPHEQKMAGILGAWRNGFSALMTLVLAIVLITFMSHNDFASKARNVRLSLADKISEQVIPEAQKRLELHNNLAALPPTHHTIGVDKPLSRDENMDTPFLDEAAKTIGHDAKGNFEFQKFRTLYSQMLIPLSMRTLLPVGIAGLFLLLMIMSSLATDDSRTFNSSAALVQDIVVPLRKKPLTPQEHLRWLRYSSLFVTVFFFFGSMLFTNVDYIMMFITIMPSIWVGGAGSVLVFGLYSRFGNTVGAYSSLFVGSGISAAGILLGNNWAQTVCPFITNHGWYNAVDGFLRSVSGPFNPYVVWHMDPVKFPINAYEVSFIALMSSIIAYIAGSLLTYKQPYNLDRMLHRGKYSIDGEKKLEEKGPQWTPKAILHKLLGITPEFTRGDKVISWSVFLYTIVYSVALCFLVPLIWNAISPWPKEWWGHYFFITSLVVPAIIGVITTVWFLIGGVIDMKRLFKDLAARVDNPLDDGRVKGHVNLMDVEALGADAVDPEPPKHHTHGTGHESGQETK